MEVEKRTEKTTAMIDDTIFSYAEDSNTGKLVHVDDVDNGLNCNCNCPNCHEPLLARHGNIREHGFAHHSKTRGANLQICYRVTMYKLAEQILQEEKYILAPSYYDIFKEQRITFEEVAIDSRFDRNDKQPDVIATTQDGKQYLIEFTFKEKVQHKKAIDYANTDCIVIDLSNQTLDTLKSFLLEKVNDKTWINNSSWFGEIESLYKSEGKPIQLKQESECQACKLTNSCCCVRQKGKNGILIIENNGLKFRLCKTEDFNSRIENLNRNNHSYVDEIFSSPRPITSMGTTYKDANGSPSSLQEVTSSANNEDNEEGTKERNCNNCSINLLWDRKRGRATCGLSNSWGTPKYPDPSYALCCKFYREKK